MARTTLPGFAEVLPADAKKAAKADICRRPPHGFEHLLRSRHIHMVPLLEPLPNACRAHGISHIDKK